MGYYQGDYYAGGMGDPFWGALAGLARRGVGALLGVARGRGAPAAAGMASTAITKVAVDGVCARLRPKRPLLRGLHGPQRKYENPGVQALSWESKPCRSLLSAAGAAGVVGAAVGAGGERMMMAHPGVAMKGFHMSKARGGHCPSAPHLVRNRRMNIANGRALARATRRLHAFAKRYRKIVGFVSPRKPKGHMYFKKKHAKK